VRVVVPSAQVPDALLLPQRAVQERQGETYVFVVGQDDTVQERPVTMGARLEGNWLVESGVAAGERVVLDGVQRLRAGAKVVVQPSANADVHADGS